MFDFNTDLADERRNILRRKNNSKEIPGVNVKEFDEKSNLKVTNVKITSKEGEDALGKPIGTYITIDINNLKIAEDKEINEASKIVARELKKILECHISNKDDILVVGLGNEYVTPDSLGPKVIKEIDITRHFLKYTPDLIDQNTRPVSAISPGVLGTTGIETVEIIKGVVDNIKPKLVIVIDSLSSKSIERISRTIQISDTGIVPGAGVGNTRNEISKRILNIPVIAIGVPMVVDAATIAADSIDLFIEKLQNNGESNDYLNKIKNTDKYSVIKEALAPKDYNLMVTPKEVDGLIENMKNVITRRN